MKLLVEKIEPVVENVELRELMAQTIVKTQEMNWGPLSMTIAFGMSNLAMILVLMNLTTVEALISAKASASAHFV